MNPILISSPVPRSGTTLVQRLLCSAPNTLIYGEDCANDINMFLNIIFHKQIFLNANKEWRNKQLASVLAGEANSWIPNLMPDVDDYFEAIKSSGLSLVKYYQDAATKNGRPIWGAKLPQWNIHSLVQIHKFLPESKVIYLVRNLADSLRSAKANQLVQGFEEAQRFCQTWKQNKDYASQNLTGERAFHLNYEDLVANPTEMIQKIELFTHSEGIDASVLEYKINTYVNNSPIGYLKPAELEDKELELINYFKE
ncbi:MAG: sulfotransferase [Chitinophagales bacterium]